MTFNPLDYPICLQIPLRLTDVTFWHQHTPFAAFLIQALKPKVFVELGTHKGDSFCAFCQAVDTLQSTTQCYAVDTWQGDEHVGFYGEEIYNDLKNYHDPLYNSFSTLLRSTFDEASGQFEDGTIDLLHIDGLHSYDAVKHDFETWLPKMSKSGVVLFHDTNVREPDFVERGYEVWRFWEEVCEHYPNFEFKFGSGLGVLGVGSEVPQTLEPFFHGSEVERSIIHDFFLTLGERIALKHAEQTFETEIQTLQQQFQKDYSSLTAHLQNVEQDRQALKQYFEGVEQDRQALKQYLEGVEQDRQALKQYLEGVKQDRQALKQYLEGVEQDRQALKKQNEQLIVALRALEQTRTVRISNKLSQMRQKIFRQR